MLLPAIGSNTLLHFAPMRCPLPPPKIIAPHMIYSSAPRSDAIAASSSSTR